MGKVLFSEKFCLLIMRFAYEAGKTLSLDRKRFYFLTGVFSITNSMNVGIS